MQWFSVILLVVVVLYFLMPRLSQVSVEEAGRQLAEGAVLVDVRTRGEFQSQSIPGSTNVPLHELDQAVKTGQLNPEQPILVFCQSGMRSGRAEKTLKSMGFAHVRNIGSFHRAEDVYRQMKAASAQAD